MTIHFHIHYRTQFGQSMVVELSENQKPVTSVLMKTFDGENWRGAVKTKATQIDYAYSLEVGELSEKECGVPRALKIPKGKKHIYLHDQWRAFGEKKHIFESAAFTKVFLKRPTTTKSTRQKAKGNTIKFTLNIPNISTQLIPAVVGSTHFLGNWEKPIPLEESNFPIVENTFSIEGSTAFFEYKYVLLDRSTKKIFQWESGANRSATLSFAADKSNLAIINDEGFNYDKFWWRRAGVAIPVFSQRSEKGFGIGEFSDLMLMADWAAKTGMKMIQVLPVNDTIATKTWADSYPYAAISVFALHPIYINIEKIAAFKNKSDQVDYEKKKTALNKLEQIDFEKVLTGKFNFLNILYQQEKEKVFASKAYKDFFKTNMAWLKPYAAFSYLRDKYSNPNFNEWPTHSKYKAETINKLCDPKSKPFNAIAFYFFIQFFADKQLKEAKEYCRSKSVVLKGDLPIGIYRYSADAWIAPELYNMNEQAGAPPDDYAVLGQNWGFPTYNWEVMAKDDFSWWRQRMKQLSVYFDALRIDHILGFFRIWQVPLDQIEGTLGLFNPRLPYTLEELQKLGLQGPLQHWTKPFIHIDYLIELFGKETDFVIKTFLEPIDQTTFKLKEKVDSQVKIRNFLQTKKYNKYQYLLKPLTYLVSEVLLIEEPDKPNFYNPRITLNTTYFYKSLPQHERQIFDVIYSDYYFSRHNEFWKKQALWKLPALLEASDMLICGEDLGMIPASVPGVMNRLNIIPLEIQRMAKGSVAFGVPWEYNYFSVCSPSCHDMSTIRGWWEGNSDTAQKFYNQHLRRYGLAPQACSTEIVTTINREHLNAPSILAIFPIQDLVGMDEKLRRENAADEQINDPSNSKHYWRFRFHLAIENLLEAHELNADIKEMVERSGR